MSCIGRKNPFIDFRCHLHVLKQRSIIYYLRFNRFRNIYIYIVYVCDIYIYNIYITLSLFYKKNYHPNELFTYRFKVYNDFSCIDAQFYCWRVGTMYAKFHQNSKSFLIARETEKVLWDFLPFYIANILTDIENDVRALIFNCCVRTKYHTKSRGYTMYSRVQLRNIN